MNRTDYPLTAGTYTPILATRFSRRVELQVDGGQNGLLVKFPDDSYTVAYSYPPDQQPVVLGDVVEAGGAAGTIIGMPAQTGLAARAATILCYVTSTDPGATVRVTEID